MRANYRGIATGAGSSVAAACSMIVGAAIQESPQQHIPWGMTLRESAGLKTIAPDFDVNTGEHDAYSGGNSLAGKRSAVGA